MTIKNISIGLIGLGRMGLNHLRVLGLLKGVDIIFVYDIDYDHAQKIADQYSIRAIKNLEEGLELVDAVVIASPTKTHAEYIELSGNYVNNIFVEKPMTATSEEAIYISELVKKKNIFLQVGFIERFNSAVKTLETIIRPLNDVVNVDFTRTNKVSSRILDVDVVTDLMIHDIDLALYLNGPYVKITADGVGSNGKLDFVTATIKHVNGATSRLQASRITDKKMRQISVTSKKMYIDCDLLRKELIISKESVELKKEGEPYVINSLHENVEVLPQEALLSEMQSFVRKCLGDVTVIATAGVQQALEVMIVCEKIKKMCAD